MSFGLGLVKGLVGGFTRNIQQEQQARAKDDTRIAELENFIIEASLDSKKRVPQELGNMIKNAKLTRRDLLSQASMSTNSYPNRPGGIFYWRTYMCP